MSATYSGNAANGTNPNAPAITIPQDGDPLSSSSVNQGLQKLADYLANGFAPGRVRTGSIVQLQWSASGQSGTFGGTNSVVTLAPTATTVAIATLGTDVTATVGATGTHRMTANVPGAFRVWLSGNLTNSTVNTVFLTFQKNGSTAVQNQGLLGPVRNDTLGPPYMVEAYFTLVATDFIQVGIYGTNAQTYNVTGTITAPGSVGNQWFGMERVA